MTPIKESIINKKTKNKPIWLMRQAGRYLPEFRKIRKLNPNFINLCLNDNLSSKITLQPLQRFKLDAAIIFSDILMIPYGLNQEVKFKKNFGPELGPLNLEKVISSLDEDDLKNDEYGNPLECPVCYENLVELNKKQSELQNGLDSILFTIVKEWINKEWPFKKVAYPGRDYSFEDWNLMI